MIQPQWIEHAVILCYQARWPSPLSFYEQTVPFVENSTQVYLCAHTRLSTSNTHASFFIVCVSWLFHFLRLLSRIKNMYAHSSMCCIFSGKNLIRSKVHGPTTETCIFSAWFDWKCLVTVTEWLTEWLIIYTICNTHWNRTFLLNSGGRSFQILYLSKRSNNATLWKSSSSSKIPTIYMLRIC